MSSKQAKKAWSKSQKIVFRLIIMACLIATFWATAHYVGQHASLEASSTLATDQLTNPSNENTVALQAAGNIGSTARIIAGILSIVVLIWGISPLVLPIIKSSVDTNEEEDDFDPKDPKSM